MSLRNLTGTVLIALLGAAACGTPTGPLSPGGAQFQEGSSGGGGGGGGGRATTPTCVEDGKMNATQSLTAGTWVAVDSTGYRTTFTFTSNGHWERFRTAADGSTIRYGRGDWIQPMLQLYMDLKPHLTGTATSLSHCTFRWETAQEGTLLMTRQ